MEERSRARCDNVENVVPRTADARVERLSRYSHQTLRIAQDLFSHRRFLKILLSLLSFLFSTTTAAMALRSNHHGTVEKENVSPECDQSSELTCRNGACVPLDSRCDGTEQCEDGSDELDCHSTLRPTTTRKYHAYVRPSYASNETQPPYPLLLLLVQRFWPMSFRVDAFFSSYVGTRPVAKQNPILTHRGIRPTNSPNCVFD